MECAECRKPIVGAFVRATDGSGHVGCAACHAETLARLDRIRAAQKEPCDCGGVGGCDCPDNLLAITRGERAKIKEEEER